MAYAAGAASAGATGTALVPVAPVEIEYPSSDGEPLAESYFQLIPLVYAFDALRRRYADRGDVFVAADLLIYYRRGTRESVAPDVFVVLGAENRPRHSYLLWQEPKGPDFVLEITSASTRERDQGPKRETYRRLGVREYWQYDPTADYLEPPLQGLELIGERYERLPEEELADGTLRLESKVLGLELRQEAKGLRFYDPATQSYLLSSEEEQQLRRRAEQRWQRAEQRWQRAEQRWQRAEEDRQLEAAARRQAEARIAALEAMLRERGENDA